MHPLREKDRRGLVAPWLDALPRLQMMSPVFPYDRRTHLAPVAREWSERPHQARAASDVQLTQPNLNI